VAGLALVLCCGGGTAAVVGLMVTGTQALNEQARAVVSDYINALKDDKFDEAYALLCDARQRTESEEEFTERVSQEPDIASYTLHDLQLTRDLSLPADVRYANGSQDSVRFLLAQDRRSGELEVCGVAG
jgi:hypothetical protein